MKAHPLECKNKSFEPLCSRSGQQDARHILACLIANREWSKGKAMADNPHGAFIGWVKQFTKKRTAE